MAKNLGLKVATVVVVSVWGILYILPNFLDVSKIPYFPGKKVTYGLDIQGGIHLVMGVDVEGVIAESSKRLSSTITEDFKTKGVVVKNFETKPVKNNVDIFLELENADQAVKAKTDLEKNYTNLVVTAQVGSKVELRYSDVYLRDFKKKTLEQAIETIRNRIDEFGVSEPSITAQGDDRILVQLPGIEDSSRAKELINKTARLEFLMVNAEVDPAKVAAWIQEAETAGKYTLKDMKYSEYVKRLNGDLASKLPKDTKVIFEKAENAETLDAGKTPYAVKTDASVTGDDLKSAQTSYGQMNQPEVSMNFNPVGAKKFEEATGANEGKLMAVVLDDVIYAAPRINGKISGGNAVITLGGSRNFQQTLDEANMISMALRAGALPAKLELLEERTVGPSLGQDSIKKAQTAVMVGTGLLLAFLLINYKSFGVLANLALMLNGVLILAVLSSINATITLPGIAGIALTVGMAVDANVIIYERIREELKKGLSLENAIREGYSRALSSILDSNITNIAVSAILMYYGTGPVRGFGATLIVGILTSMFTAVFFTKTVADVLVHKFKVKKLYI